jgi:dCMP deaminase
MLNQVKWDRRFLLLAKEVSRWSKDPSTRVGAVITDDLGRVLSTGFNGFPRGVLDAEERYLNRDEKYKFIVHAEVNACLLAGERARGGSLYVYPSFAIPNVCHECAKVVIQAGIKRVVGFTPSGEDRQRAKRWEDSIRHAEIMLTEAGVRIVEISL